MRLGQATCSFVTLTSDPEIRIPIVPLSEAEYSQVLAKVASIDAPLDVAGAAVRDRAQAQEILVRAFREEEDLTKRAFVSVDEMMKSLEVSDIDTAFDEYSEMVANSSPRLEAIPQTELDNLKKALQEMNWNELSGRSWYALKRFLSTIMPSPLLDNWFGSISMSDSTTKSD
jgi:hypothetical protein